MPGWVQILLVFLQIICGVLLALGLLILNWMREDAQEARRAFLHEIQLLRRGLDEAHKALAEHVNNFHRPRDPRD